MELEKDTQQKYTQKLLTVQEEEGKRISFELHNSVGQDLLVVKNLIHFGKKNKINVIEDDKFYETIFDSTSRAIEEVRDILRALHPIQFVNLGLTQAIKSIINGFKNSTKRMFKTRINNIDGIIKNENEIHIYRILQEALNNIIKHSDARKVKIFVNNDENVITISIIDNGKGFDTSIVSRQSNGLGLNSLSERVNLLNGEISISSDINNGTEIIAKIPLKE